MLFTQRKEGVGNIQETVTHSLVVYSLLVKHVWSICVLMYVQSLEGRYRLHVTHYWIANDHADETQTHQKCTVSSCQTNKRRERGRFGDEPSCILRDIQCESETTRGTRCTNSRNDNIISILLTFKWHAISWSFLRMRSYHNVCRSCPSF